MLTGHSLVKGLGDVFRIGYDYGSARCRSAAPNMQSAGERPCVIDTFLTTELAAERVLGPVDLEGSIQVNRFGLVPKGHVPDQWRLIVDLSFQEKTASMMVLIRSCVGFDTHQWMSPVRRYWSWAKVRCWRSLMCLVPFGQC